MALHSTDLADFDQERRPDDSHRRGAEYEVRIAERLFAEVVREHLGVVRRNRLDARLERVGVLELPRTSRASSR